MKNISSLSSSKFLPQTTEISAKSEKSCSDFRQKLLRIIKTYILNPLLTGSEPKIIEKTDKIGNLFWQVYDPVSGDRKKLVSVQEVREWLDNRYYYL